MTPAPMMIIFSGTEASLSAPVDETMRSSSISTPVDLNYLFLRAAVKYRSHCIQNMYTEDKGIRKWFPIGKLDAHLGAINCYNSLNVISNRRAEGNSKYYDDWERVPITCALKLIFCAPKIN